MAKAINTRSLFHTSDGNATLIITCSAGYRGDAFYSDHVRHVNEPRARYFLRLAEDVKRQRFEGFQKQVGSWIFTSCQLHRAISGGDGRVVYS